MYIYIYYVLDALCIFFKTNLFRKKQAWLNHRGQYPGCTFPFFLPKLKNTSGLFWNHPPFFGRGRTGALWIHGQRTWRTESQSGGAEFLDARFDVENSRRARLGESWGILGVVLAGVKQVGTLRSSQKVVLILEFFYFLVPTNRIHPQNIYSL